MYTLFHVSATNVNLQYYTSTHASAFLQSKKTIYIYIYAYNHNKLIIDTVYQKFQAMMKTTVEGSRVVCVQNNSQKYPTNRTYWQQIPSDYLKQPKLVMMDQKSKSNEEYDDNYYDYDRSVHGLGNNLRYSDSEQLLLPPSPLSYQFNGYSYGFVVLFIYFAHESHGLHWRHHRKQNVYHDVNSYQLHNNLDILH